MSGLKPHNLEPNYLYVALFSKVLPNVYRLWPRGPKMALVLGIRCFM